MVMLARFRVRRILLRRLARSSGSSSCTCSGNFPGLGAVLQYAENLENFKKGATKHNRARPIQRQVSSQALCYAQLQLDCTEGNLARNSCIRRDPTLEKFPSGSRFHRPRNLNATALKVVVPGLRQGACRSLRRLHEILSRWERCRTWFWDVLGVPNLSADPSTLNL